MNHIKNDPIWKLIDFLSQPSEEPDRKLASLLLIISPTCCSYGFTFHSNKRKHELKINTINLKLHSFDLNEKLWLSE